MKILIVEDEEKIAEFLKASLEGECFAVDYASDGETGSYWARTNMYDAIILDNILPKKLGIDVCKEIRASGNNTPIIILSVRSESYTKVQLLDAGADDYLIKPFSFGELMARLRALMRRQRAISSDILQVDDVLLDTRRHIVMKDGREIHITRREFMLLEYFMRNPGTVLSRGMIMEHVWDMSVDPFSKTIETHVLSLRRKLGDKDKGQQFIRTITSRGYLLESINNA